VTAAVLHLIRQHGRRRIAFLRGERGNEDAAEREGGYRAALALAGIPFDEALMLEGDYDTETARASIEAMMASGLRPGDGFDAVFAADDDSAWGAMLALRRRGVGVPDLVSVMGFDDQRYAEMMDPPLSTVRAPTELVGRLAARSLLARLRGDLSRKDVVLPTEAIFRRSCGCPASTYH
jgi:DNA-binding LacI/PurR family transcriptional regulator